MAAVEVTISGVLYDKIARTTQPVVLIGEATLTGLGVGGGPIIPPPTKPPLPPLGIWPGPGDPDFPGDGKPPRPPTGIWPGPGDPDFPGSGPGVPPINPPPVENPPQPGDPTTPLPPPSGSPGWPVSPIVPPPFIIVNYPGIGPVVVAPPAPTTPPPAE